MHSAGGGGGRWWQPRAARQGARAHLAVCEAPGGASAAKPHSGEQVCGVWRDDVPESEMPAKTSFWNNAYVPVRCMPI